VAAPPAAAAAAPGSAAAGRRRRLLLLLLRRHRTLTPPLTPRLLQTPINVLWTIQTCNLVGTMLVLGYVVIYLKFVLIPLIMAYFMTFLMAFIIDPMELRPYPKPCGAIYLADAEGELIKESLCRGF